MSGLSASSRELLAGMAAAGVYLALVLLAGLKWWVPLLPAGLVYWGLHLFLPRRLEDHEVQVARGLTRARLREVLAAGRSRAGELRTLAGNVGGGDVAAGVDRLAAATEAIFDRLEGDPGRYPEVKMFEGVVLEQSLKAVRAYATLAAAAGSARHRSQMAHFERMLPSLVGEFERLAGPDVSRAAARMSTALDVLGKLGHDDDIYRQTAAAESHTAEGVHRE